MTFALSRNDGEFEWAGDTIFTLFCQPRNLFRLSMWRMIWDIVRFNACARQLVYEDDSSSKGGKEELLRDYLDAHDYSRSFRDDYLIVGLMYPCYRL